MALRDNSREGLDYLNSVEIEHHFSYCCISGQNLSTFISKNFEYLLGIKTHEF